MKHSRAIQYLELGRGELSALAINRLDRHIAGCEECRLQVREATSLDPILARMGMELPAGFERALERVRQQTMRAVQAEARKAPAWSWLPQLGRMSPAVLSVAAAGLVVGLLISFGTGDLLKSPFHGSSISTAPTASLVAGNGDSRIAPGPAKVLQAPSQVPEPVSVASLEQAGKTTTASAPGRVRRRPSATGSSAPDFMIVKNGAEVRIEWLGDGHGHLVRKAEDPAGAHYAMAERVDGDSWRDSGHPEPNTTVYYLVD